MKKYFELNPVKGLSFNDEDGKHIHLLNGREVPGCTSISGLFQDDGWKFAWPVKLMAEKLMPFVKDGIVIEEDDLKKAKNAWREKRDKSADSGTVAHKIIEDYIKNNLTILEFPNDEVRNCWNEFKNWEKEFRPVWLASEVQVGSVEHQFAGILDALAEIDGELVLMDFKTSSGIKPEYSIQLAGLQICLEEQGFRLDQRAILHLPKEGTYEYKIIETDLEFEKKCFLSALNFYGYKNRFMGGKRDFR